MNVSVERIESAGQADAATRIRTAVFGRALQARLADPFEELRASLHLLARVQPSGRPVATLSVVETTGDLHLHSGFNLPFGRRARVARYTQMAVLKPYRGWHIPLRLILEGHSAFVAPGRYQFTWLLFNADRAATSSLCRLLGFQPGTESFQTAFGRVRALVREETAAQSEMRNLHSALAAGALVIPAAAAEFSTDLINGLASYPAINAGRR